MGVGAGLYMYDVVVKKFTKADEILLSSLFIFGFSFYFIFVFQQVLVLVN